MARVCEVCPLDLYAKYYFRFIFALMCEFKVYHPFDGFYWNAPIQLEGGIGNLKGKYRQKKCEMGGGGKGGLWHKSYLSIKKC